jgi:hypothetical protein
MTHKWTENKFFQRNSDKSERHTKAPSSKPLTAKLSKNTFVTDRIPLLSHNVIITNELPIMANKNIILYGNIKVNICSLVITTPNVLFISMLLFELKFPNSLSVFLIR